MNPITPESNNTVENNQNPEKKLTKIEQKTQEIASQNLDHVNAETGKKVDASKLHTNLNPRILRLQRIAKLTGIMKENKWNASMGKAAEIIQSEKTQLAAVRKQKKEEAQKKLQQLIEKESAELEKQEKPTQEDKQ